MKEIAEQNMKIGAVFQPMYYPVKFDNMVEFDKINNNTRDKLQWVMYSCQDQCDSEILGSNSGDGDRSGMLGNIVSTFQGKAPFHVRPKANTTLKSVPFFMNQTFTNIEKTIDNEIYDRLEYLNTIDFTEARKTGGFDFIPDGAYNISVLNKNSIKFDVKVNDVRQLNMHRYNAISGLRTLRILKQPPIPANSS